MKEREKDKKVEDELKEVEAQLTTLHERFDVQTVF